MFQAAGWEEYFGSDRRIGVVVATSVIGAAAFMYSTAMAFFIEWPLAFSWAFLPLVLLGVRRVGGQDGRADGNAITNRRARG